MKNSIKWLYAFMLAILAQGAFHTDNIANAQTNSLANESSEQFSCGPCGGGPCGPCVKN